MKAVTIPSAVRRGLIAHARRERPNECCGFLIGRGGIVQFAVPMTNVEASPVRYRISDAAHIECRRLIRAFVPPLAIVGVYHSHPKGKVEPSESDIADAMYPEWIYAIVGLAGPRPAVRAFQIDGSRVREVALRP